MAATKTSDASVILVEYDMHPKTLCSNKYDTLLKVFYFICKQEHNGNVKFIFSFWSDDNK